MFVTPDFSRLPKITYGKAFFCVDEDVVKVIEPLEHTLARAQNAVRFAWFSTGDAELMRCNELEAVRLRAA